MRRSVFGAILSATMLVSHAAVAQAFLSPLEHSSFFGPISLKSITSDGPSIGGPPNPFESKPAITVGDKDHPWTRRVSGVGTLYAFQYQRDTILALAGNRPIDLGAGILLPSDAFVVQDFVFLLSHTGGTLRADAFPAELKTQVDRFWPSGLVRLLPNGAVVRAEPTGDVLDGLRQFLSLDAVGRTVVSFERNENTFTTGIMLFGTLKNPFQMTMTLTDPMVSFTKREGRAKASVALASDITVSGRTYELKVQGSKLTKPDIFVLRTEKMTPQDVQNLARALSAPVLGLARDVDPGWRLDAIPTFELHAPVVLPQEFRTEDRDKVVIYAAAASNPDWNITQPGIRIAASLIMQALQQTVGSVVLGVDKSGLDARFRLTSLRVPDVQLEFATAAATISAKTSGTSMSVEAESPNPCFKQKITFAVDSKGHFSTDVSANRLASQFNPTTYASNMKACAGDGVDFVKFVLTSGVKLLGFAEDKLLDAAAPIFGARNVALAAKAANLPISLVGAAVGKVLSTTELLNLAEEVYGVNQVVSLAQGAGKSVEDIMTWGLGKSKSAEAVGQMFKGSTYATKAVLDGGLKVFKSSGVVSLAKSAGMSADDVMTWGKNAGKTAEQMGDMFGNKPFSQNDLLNAGRRVFADDKVAAIAKAASYGAIELFEWGKAAGMGPDKLAASAKNVFDPSMVLYETNYVYGLTHEETAEMGRLVGYTASQVGAVFKFSYGYTDSGVAHVLRAAGFSQNEVIDAVERVFSIGEDAAKKAWKAAEKIGGQIGGYFDPRKW